MEPKIKIHILTEEERKEEMKYSNRQFEFFQSMSHDDIIDCFFEMDYPPTLKPSDTERFKQTIFKDHFVYLYELFEKYGLCNVIKLPHETQYRFTTRYYDIKREGGWKVHLKNISEERKRREALEKSVINTNSFQWITTFTTVIIIGLNCFVDYENYQLTKQSNLDKQAVARQSQLLEEFKSIKKLQIEVRESLKNYRKSQSKTPVVKK